MRWRRSEEGVTIVEAAFVIPLLFVFVFGLIDFGLWGLEKGQATSAARDGARAAIVLPIAVDTEKADVLDKIQDAVEARVTEDVDAVTVECDRNGDNAGYGDCWGAQNVVLADYGVARIKVTVEWSRPFLTGVGDLFGDAQNVKGTSSMVIVGAPS